MITFIFGVLLGRYFLLFISHSFWNLFLTIMLLMFYLNFTDNLSNKILQQIVYDHYAYGKPFSEVRKISAILLPLIVEGAIVFILLYNLYELPHGRIYFSIDSDLFIRIGKHNLSHSTGRSYFILETRSENFYDEIIQKMDKMFNHDFNRLSWLRLLTDADKHKVLCWFRERLYWSIEYHCKENQIEFDEYYWGSISASIKIIKIRSQDFPTDHTWRHDPFNFDVPTGSTNHPRILLKFYHD